MLHARRLLVYHGEMHGADPRLRGRRLLEPAVRAPTATPTRCCSAARAAPGDRSRRSACSSTTRPRGRVQLGGAAARAGRPRWPRACSARRRAGCGRRSRSTGGRAHTFLFSDAAHFYGSPTRASSAGRYAADLVEAVGGPRPGRAVGLAAGDGAARRCSAGRRSPCSACVAGAAALRPAPLRGLRGAWRSCRWPCSRSWCGASWPTACAASRRRQALERAAVARKAVEDFALLPARGGPAARQPVTDDALVWVASLHPQRPRRLRGRAAAGLEQARAVRLRPAAPAGLGRGVPRARARGPARRAAHGDDRRLLLPGGLGAGAPRRGRAGHPVDAPGPAPARGGGRARGPRPHDPAGLRRCSSRPAALLAQSMARRISGPIRDLTERHPAHRARATSRRASAPRSRDELRDAGGLLQPDGGGPRPPAPRPRAQQPPGRLGRDGAPGGPRGQEPAHADPALGGAPAPGVRATAAWTSGRRWSAAPTRSWARCATLRADRDRVLRLRAAARRRCSSPRTWARWSQDVLAPYRRALPPGVKLAVRVEPGTPRVRADRRLLERAVLNLVENALQAVGERGRDRRQPRLARRPRGGRGRGHGPGPRPRDPRARLRAVLLDEDRAAAASAWRSSRRSPRTTAAA